MLRLLALLILIGILAGAGISAVWYVQTPQPIGVHAQVEYARQVAIYKYYDYKRDRKISPMEYWRPLADQGNMLAQTEMAQNYFVLAQNNPEAYQVAVAYLYKAANEGEPYAQNALGVALRKGLGIEQNKVDAWKWFSLSARQGVALAQKNLDDLTPELTSKELMEADLRVNIWLKKIRTYR